MKDLIWNILTILALLGVAAVVLLVMIIYMNPNIGFNPLPPDPLVTPQPVTVIPPTATRQGLPPTWTPVVTDASGNPVEPTLRPSATPILTTTKFKLGTFTVTPTRTPTRTQTRTQTLTPTPTFTPTHTKVPTFTPLPTYTIPPTLTQPPTLTPTPF
ncbi:MAG TPA: hypothetical protein PKW33_06600 [Anaerolineaceae bacterium]|nr:hypothetical protein [Anaerolineaceae bacterium]HPN51238.1 hypothetical protein [Anaerolineaceae bacterium]